MLLSDTRTIDAERESEREDGGDKWEGRYCEKEIEDRNTEEEKKKNKETDLKKKTEFTNPALFLFWLLHSDVLYNVSAFTSTKYCWNNDFKICVIWPFSRSGVPREKLVQVDFTKPGERVSAVMFQQLPVQTLDLTHSDPEPL